ncbi:MAG: glycosyltransferase [Anaerolineae bacterium]
MDSWPSQQELASRFGVIVPVYFSPAADTELVRHLLTLTLQDTPAYLPWEQVWLVVDGDLRAADILNELRPRLGAFHILVEPENHGKLWVVRHGMQAVLGSQPQLDFIVTRDCDSDHAASDLPGLVHTADLLKQHYAHTRLLVIGARRSRQRPMGWLRGELELLLDQVTLAALQYHLAAHQHALYLGLCQDAHDIDLNSGYKLYGRDLARQLFAESEPNFAGIAPIDYWHYGPETCPVVEALIGDAVLAEVPRLTLDGQPSTSFGSFDPTRLYGCILSWVFNRLEIPLAAAAAWFDNSAARLSLKTTRQGCEILEKLRAFTLGQVAARQMVSAVPPPAYTLPFI